MWPKAFKKSDKIQSQVEVSSGTSEKELRAELAFQRGNVLVMLTQMGRAIEAYSHAIITIGELPTRTKGTLTVLSRTLTRR